MKIQIDNWRWSGVPFYLCTGKHMARRVTEISIQFRSAPFQLFRNTPVEELQTNRLVIAIQPEESIALSFGAKIPGPIMQQGKVDMCFNYADYFGSAPSTGYERLLYDCMIGDAWLRTSALRLHDRGRDTFSKGRHGGSWLECDHTCARRLAGSAATRLPQLCARDVGSQRSGANAARWRA